MNMFEKKYSKYYIIETLLIIFVIFALFYLKSNKWLFSLIIFFLFFLTNFFIGNYKKRNVNENQAFLMIITFALIFVVFIYILGFYFGFYKSTVLFSFWTIRKYILPLGLIIFFSEKIRNILIVCKNKLSIILLFIFTFLIDIYIYFGSYDLSKLEEFADVLGYVVASAFINNLFFHYYCCEFDSKGIIIFKMITILYPYIIPIQPDIFTFFKTFIRMSYAYIMYYFMNDTFSKKKVEDKKSGNIISTMVVIFICAVLCMLISCKFKYGIMVVASESMHGTFEKGDAVLFVSYTNQTLHTGDIILFKHKDMILIHRIIQINIEDSNYHYITKGDDNDNIDEGYSVKDDVTGKYILHIKYIGYPTLWIRDLFGL